MPIVEAFDPVSGQVRQMTSGDLNPCLGFNETTTPLGISATYTGTARDTGVSAGSTGRYSSFNAFALTDQAGVMRIECSNDNSTWGRMTIDQALTANTPLILTVPVMARYHRVVIVNGATAQGALRVNSSYTAA